MIYSYSSRWYECNSSKKEEYVLCIGRHSNGYKNDTGDSLINYQLLPEK